MDPNYKYVTDATSIYFIDQLTKPKDKLNLITIDLPHGDNKSTSSEVENDDQIKGEYEDAALFDEQIDAQYDLNEQLQATEQSNFGLDFNSPIINLPDSVVAHTLEPSSSFDPNRYQLKSTK